MTSPSLLKLCATALVLARTLSGPALAQGDDAAKEARLKKLDATMEAASDAGRYAEAEAAAREALRIREEVLGPEHPEIGTMLCWLAQAIEAQGRYDEARPLYERAPAIDEKALGPDAPDVATDLNNLALLLHAAGYSDAARPLFERALAIDEKALGRDDPEVATDLNNLAELLRAQGQYDASLPLHERALAIREKALGKDHPDTATSLNNLAMLLSMLERPAEARPLYERALRIFEKALGPEHPHIAVLLNNLALLDDAQGHPDAAMPRYERALAIWQKALGPEHPSVAKGLINLAKDLETQDRPDEALPLRERALAILEKALDPDHPDVVQCRNALACLLSALGKDEAARPLFESSLTQLEANLRRGLGGLQGPERLNRIATTRFVLDSWLAAAPRCGRTGYEETLRLRGLVTRVEAGERALLRAGGDEAKARREELLALDRQLGGLSALCPRDPAMRADWRARCAGIASRREAMLLALAHDYAPMRDAQARLDLGLDSVQARLAPGEVLLDFLRTKDSYLAFVVPAKGDVLRVDLGRGIDEAAEEFVAAACKGDWEGAAGARLASLVLDPLRKKLPPGAKRLLVCPDASLAAVPFGALPGSRPGSFLVDEFEIAYLEMAQDLVPPAHPATPGRGALLVGGVDYGRAELAHPPAPAPSGGAPATGKRWEPLPGTEDEAPLLREREGTVVLSGASAAESRFRALSRGKAVLHIATHGYVNTDRLARTLGALERARTFDASIERQMAVGTDPMLLAGVVLAGANVGDGGGGDDGLLTAAEISWLNLDGVKLAVLSACDTGRGTPAAGEGTLGLVRAFRLAGAQAVVASLWMVDDRATALLMGKFYEGYLVRRLSAAAALREAALSVRDFTDEDGKRKYEEPRYWAAFVAYGR